MAIIRAARAADIPQVRELLREYAAAVDCGDCFQNFEHELSSLPENYSPPEGRLLVAVESAHAVGCVALRRLTEDGCEMKRLYVTPPFRGRGLGRSLAEAIIAEARAAGYAAMRLDTLASMQAAQALYAALGFREIDPYSENRPIGARFMELRWRA